MSLADGDRFRIREQGKTIVVKRKNGRRLKATCKFTSFEVDSLVGRIRVPLRTIDRGTVTMIEKPRALQPVNVSVSGQYAHHKTEYASDRQQGMSWSSGDWKGWIEFDLGEEHHIAHRMSFGVPPVGTCHSRNIRVRQTDRNQPRSRSTAPPLRWPAKRP